MFFFFLYRSFKETTNIRPTKIGWECRCVSCSEWLVFYYINLINEAMPIDDYCFIQVEERVCKLYDDFQRDPGGQQHQHMLLCDDIASRSTEWLKRTFVVAPSSISTDNTISHGLFSNYDIPDRSTFLPPYQGKLNDAVVTVLSVFLSFCAELDFFLFLFDFCFRDSSFFQE